MSMDTERTWEYVRGILVRESTDREAPLKDFWGYKCPECKKSMYRTSRWIKDTHYLIQYWGCKHCGYEYAIQRLASQVYAEYATSPVYNPEEKLRIPSLWSWI